MPFEKGKSKTGGKKKGTQNKTTKDIKIAYQMLIEKNLDNMTKWLEKVAANDPAKAIYIISDLSEYVIPKLARQELTGKDGEKLETPIINILPASKLKNESSPSDKK